MFHIPLEHLARHLNLTELRVGARRTDGVGGPRVLAWWTASVCPSFARPWVVGAVHEELWTGGPDPDWVAVRGFVADVERAAIAPLGTDSGLAALESLNPFRVEPTHRQKALDGLGYQLRWGTQAVRGGLLAFSNPRAPWLIELERALFRFARQVVAAAGTPSFESQLACWAVYREPLKQAAPGTSSESSPS